MKKIILPIALFSVFLQAQTDSLKKSANIDEIVITGTMKAVRKDKSPVPVEVYQASYFSKNPTSNIADALSMINGVRPQINCSVCNTTDIHINGLDGPYTMVLIDGMPIVSALSTVYGFSGIPVSMIERVEVAKGPASALYGSEAMGGIINIITKNSRTAPKFSADMSTSTWGEQNTDLGAKLQLGKASSLLGVNYFNFTNRIDKNKDNFMDAALQNRISVFNKWNFERQEGRTASLMARYMYEDRLGGELQWEKKYRGGSEVYGESIYTNRMELIGAYQLPVKEEIYTQFSFNYHGQDSRYGDKIFNANQRTIFGQTYWDKSLGKHHLLVGISARHQQYDDNTPATDAPDGKNNMPDKHLLIGGFFQDEWIFNDKNTLLLGFREDYSKVHGNIHSPRVAYKFSPTPLTNIRASFGTGFRVVNLFTEDHAALTGARQVVVPEELKPERSINGNLNITQKIVTDRTLFNFDITGFYSYFNNKIIGDFETDQDKIFYNNLKGHAVSSGVSLNTEVQFSKTFTAEIGATYMDVFQKYDEGGVATKRPQKLFPKWSGTYTMSLNLPRKWTADVTGQVTGPMNLIVLENDFRPEKSPWYNIANVQVRKSFNNGMEIYGGVKNLFDFVPKNPLMRPFDPFDKHVDEPSNPYHYNFDTEYGYASMMKRRVFIGFRYTIL